MTQDVPYLSSGRTEYRPDSAVSTAHLNEVSRLVAMLDWAFSMLKVGHLPASTQTRVVKILHHWAESALLLKGCFNISSSRGSCPHAQRRLISATNCVVSPSFPAYLRSEVLHHSLSSSELLFYPHSYRCLLVHYAKSQLRQMESSFPPWTHGTALLCYFWDLVNSRANFIQNNF